MGGKTKRASVAAALILFSLLLVGCATDYAAYDTYGYRSGRDYYDDDYWGGYYYGPYWYGYGYYPWYWGHRHYPPYYHHRDGDRSRDKGQKFVPPRQDGGPGKSVIGEGDRGGSRGGNSFQMKRPGGGSGGRSFDRGRSGPGSGSKEFNRQVN